MRLRGAVRTRAGHPHEGARDARGIAEATVRNWRLAVVGLLSVAALASLVGNVRAGLARRAPRGR
jgi:hypothetical protein